MKVSPHIHLIKFYDFFILFDVNKNEAKLISKKLYDEFVNIIDNNIDIQNYLTLNKDLKIKEEIYELLEKGFLKNKRPKVIEHPEQDFYLYYSNKKMRKLILQVTQACNFRCSYCDYSCGDENFHRKHNNTNMSEETAMKAIAFFKKHSLDQDRINISFYGGEPLINFSLIKKCIETVNNEFAGKHISYNLTTNGLLLNPEKAIYLIDNNVNITVSLDGPQSIHDKNRKLAINGRGTFDLIIQNLKYLYLNYPEYYSKINYNCVVDPRIWDNSCNDFFQTAMFEKSHVVFSPMHPVNGRNIYYPTTYLIRQKKAELSAISIMITDNYLKNINMESKYWFEKQTKTNSHLGKQIELPDVCGHSGPCIPGVNRLFVNTNGDLFPCEKANEKSDVMTLGNIVTGIDMDKAINMLNITKLMPEKCRNCWGILHCNICACTIDAGNYYSKEMNNMMCKQELDQLEKNIIRKVIIEKFYEKYRSEYEQQDRNYSFSI